MKCKTSKVIAICLILGAISKSTFAQIRLGAVSTTHLTSAASLNTPSVSNALRASSAASVSTASRVAGTAAASASQAGSKAATATRQIEGKTTTAVNSTAVNSTTDAAPDVSAGVAVKSSASIGVQKK